MGLHHQATHGRVFRGIDATKHLEMRKRDSHGSKIVMHVPEHMKAAARPADPEQLKYMDNKVAATEQVATYTSVVYQTLSADFDGPIAGYTTLSANPTPTAATAVNVAQSGATDTASSATPTNSHESAYAAAKSAAMGASTTVVATSVASVSPTSAAASSSSSVEDGSNNRSNFLNAPTSAVVATTASATLGAAAVGGTPLSATRGNGLSGTPLSATRAPIAEDGYGMSTGAKAGLAFGIIIAFALAAGLVFFCWRRRRNPNAHQEIHDEKRVSSGSSFFGGKAMSEKRASAISVAHSIRSAASTAPRLSLRPVTQFLPSLSSDNRKSAGNTLDPASAAMSEKPKSMWERRSQTTQNPFDDADAMDEKTEAPANPFDEPEANASEKSSADSPAKVEAAAVVPVAASAPRGPNNVHRVQLDFKPSMEDELELKSGQLVRMLHAYDDGWALCIRMDRSQQGVVPRTCLSKLPVKPRPQGPPSQSLNGPPMSPTGPPGMTPRPLTQTGRDRTGSSAGIERPSTPTGVPARKPVPGQAI
ncbi:hypothetical protein B0A55_00889 [Friedmanniomyces simplex]|uniref:SH3 domain-containing protein n=1 Tax=Friedmanniomyces simplex TaxID=329884 RepID=A0A4U0Y658_9PEZI|nr:hypothetical protein B0A55_00889 [Friedmanniomyces simplex]